MNSVLNTSSDKEFILKLIADNMVKTRPSAEVEYRPCIKQKEVKQQTLYFSYVDFAKLYPEAKLGDVAYAVTNLTVPHTEDIYLCVRGNVKVFYKGELVCTHNSDDFAKIPLKVEKGDNEVIIKCICDETGFGFHFSPCTIHYPTMWAKDYLFYINNTLPIEEFEGEEGFAFSRLYSGGNIDTEFDFEKGVRDYVPIISDVKENIVDFDRVYDAETDDVAWALTYCNQNSQIRLLSDSMVKVYINGTECTSLDLSLKNGDEILVMCQKGDRPWQFQFDGLESIGIPFLKTSRKSGVKWLLLGNFDNQQMPEIQFTRTYTDKMGKECFWRFTDGVSYLRPYLDTYFFGQWFYAIMVGEYGILKVSELLGKDYENYFKAAMGIMVRYFDYMKYDAGLFGAPSFLQRSINLDNLDVTGTIGMNLAELYMMEKDDAVFNLLNTLSSAAENNIPRFSDGTYRRPETMWADDTFMSCPFLVRMGKITGDSKYYNECIRQIKGFKKRLYNEKDQIFSHIYFVDDEKANGVYWGRGNGWVFFTLSELLMTLPETDEKEELLDLFRSFAEGIRRVQDKSGMWHQVLNQESTYLETSCTAMFILGMARGIKYGWLSNDFRGTVNKAWKGIFETAIDIDGNVYGVCKGSGCSYDWEYYAKLGTVINDDHGTGVVLAALCETIKLEQKI